MSLWVQDGTWLMFTWNMTNSSHSWARCDWFIRGTLRIHKWDVEMRLWAWDETWLVHTCDMTHASYPWMRKDSCICVHMWGMTYSYMELLHGLVSVRGGMTHSCVRHDSFIWFRSETCLIHTWNMTHLCTGQIDDVVIDALSVGHTKQSISIFLHTCDTFILESCHMHESMSIIHSFICMTSLAYMSDITHVRLTHRMSFVMNYNVSGPHLFPSFTTYQKNPFATARTVLQRSKKSLGTRSQFRTLWLPHRFIKIRPAHLRPVSIEFLTICRNPGFQNRKSCGNVRIWRKRAAVRRKNHSNLK